MKKRIYLYLLVLPMLLLNSCVKPRIEFKFNLNKDETLKGTPSVIELYDPIINGVENVLCEKEGYNFLGWSLDGKTLLTDADYAEEYTITLKPIFEKTSDVKTYKVTFKVSGMDDIVLKYKTGEKIIVPSISKEGYKFIGFDQEVPSVMGTSDLEFTAIFEEIINEYTVTFKVKGIDDIVLKYKTGEKIIVPSISKEGYKFIGFDQEVPSVMGTSNLVFNAMFKANYYEINYNYVEGMWPTRSASSTEELLNELLTDFYYYLESSDDLESFIKGSDGKYASGLWYNSRSKLYMAEVKDEKSDATCFINDSRYYHKWINFFNELDKIVTEINAAQSLWNSTYVGIIRIYEICDSNVRYTEEQLQRIKDSLKLEKEPVTRYKPGEEVELLELSLNDGRQFLGWYLGEEKITKITSDMRGDLNLVAKWSNPIYPTSLYINNPVNSLDKNASYTLDISILPTNTTHPELVYESSNEEVATIKNGVINTLKYGSVVITIYSKYAPSVKQKFSLEVFPDISNDLPVIYISYDTSEILVVNVNEDVDIRKGIKAYDKTDKDLTNKITVDDSGVDYENAGVYKIKYQVTDKDANTCTLERTVKVVEPSELIFIGHAGSYLGIMNTEEAFLNGILVKGYKALECDVKQTKDGVFVTCHDNDFNGVDLASTNYQDLVNVVKTQTRGGVSYSSKICTFERYLEICKEYGVIAVVELKSSKGITNSDQSRMGDLMKVISDKGMLDKVIFLGSQYKCLEWVRNNGYDYIPCQYLVNSIESETIFERCVNWNFDVSFNISYDNSTEWIERYHDMGLKVSSYTFNQYTSASTLQDWINKGVDYVTCDVLTEKDVKLPTYEDDNLPEYHVVFKNYDGTVLKESVIKEGKKAFAPSAPSVNGYKFIGWDTDFSSIKSNLVVNALFEIEEYTISYESNLVEVTTYTWKDKEEFLSEFYNDWFTWIKNNAGSRSGITFDGKTYTVKMNTSTYGTVTFDNVQEMRNLGVYYVEQTIGTLVYKPITSTNNENYEMEIDENYFLNTEPYRSKYKALNAYFLNVMNTTYTSYNKNYKPTSAGKVQIFFRFHQWQKGTNIASFNTLPVKYETKIIEVTNLVMPTLNLKYTINDELSLEVPSCDGYTFEGWYKEAECINKVTNIYKGTYGDLKLYAKWIKN